MPEFLHQKPPLSESPNKKISQHPNTWNEADAEEKDNIDFLPLRQFLNPS